MFGAVGFFFGRCVYGKMEVEYPCFERRWNRGSTDGGRCR